MRYFGFRWDRKALRGQLERAVRDLPASPHKVRFTGSRRGQIRMTTERLSEKAARRPEDAPETPWSLALAETPVSSDDVFLFHKTTHRRVYDEARAAHPDVDEVILVNERGELTEGTRFNLVLELEGELVTPPVASGLLGGVFRQRLLRDGAIRERVLRPADLDRAETIWLVNSVRGFRRGRRIVDKDENFR